MPSLLILLTGKKDTGKTTEFYPILQTIAGAEGVSVERVSSSDILRPTLIKRGIPDTRENLQKLFIDKFDGGKLSRAVAKLIRKSSADIVVYDGVRQMSDYVIARDFEYLTIHMIASPKIRYRRAKESGKKAACLTSQKAYLANDRIATEKPIVRLARAAGAIRIHNNDSKTVLYNAVHEVFYRHICPRIFAESK